MFKDVVARDYKEEGSGTGATNYKLLFISTIITAYYVSSVGGRGYSPRLGGLCPDSSLTQGPKTRLAREIEHVLI